MAPRSRWIQYAIKNRGALRRWTKRHRKQIRRYTGEDPLTKRGTIKTSVLERLRRTKYYRRLSPTTKRRINLAITLARLRKK